MILRRSLVSVALLSMVLSSMASTRALAYIPPSEFIIKTMLQKKVALKLIRTRGSVMGMTGDGNLTGIRFVEEALYDSSSGTLRSVALDETGRELYSIERTLERDSSGKEPRALVSALLFENRMGNLLPLLRRWDIPIKQEEELLKLAGEAERRDAEKTFFGRQKLASGLQVSWVIGEKSSNQLWIEKDTFLPSKLSLKSGDGYEIQFDSYRMTKEVPTPRVITVTRGSEQVLRQEFQDVSVNSSELAETKRTVANGFTEVGDSADNEVRELIRRYYSLIR